MPSAVLIPVKSFDSAKDRLAASMGPAERNRLARSMATAVVRAADPLPCFVVCDDPYVAEWAVGAGARVIWRPVFGLNPVVSAAAHHLASIDFNRIIIAHGDLPFASDLSWVDEGSGVTIVTDRRGDGTNVMALPTDAGFRFAYGPGSAAAHRAEAERVGLACRLVSDDLLGWDIDTPEDLTRLPDLSEEAP